MRRARLTAERLESRQLLAGISGTVFEDRNNNGVYAAPDLGVTTTVYLDANDNGSLDAGETSTTSGGMTSGQWGRYSFSGLAIGTYRVRAVLPANFAQTYPLNNGALVVTLTNPSTTTLTSHIGLRNVTQSSRFAGRAYADTNKNAARESTEAYLANVAIYNDKNDNGVPDAGEESTVTDGTGAFRLDVLNPNFTTTYRILAVAPAGLTQTTQLDTGGAYVRTMDAGNALIPSDMFGFADVTPPQVTHAGLELDARPHVIRFDLSEPLGQIPWQLSLLFSVKRTADVNGPTNVTLPAGSFTLSTGTPGVLRYTLNTSTFADGLLPDGVYQATIPSGSLKDSTGNTNTSSYTFEFHVLRGDANGDRKVDFGDLVILAQNYNATGRTFSQGNFNFSADGAVGFDDLVLLAQSYNAQLPPGTPPLMSASVSIANSVLGSDEVVAKKRRRV